MRTLLGLIAALGVAAGGSAVEARGRDSARFSLPQYDETALDGLLSAPNYDTRALDRMIDARIAPGGDAMNWRFGEASLDEGDGGVDHWRMAFAEADGALPPGLAQALDPQARESAFAINYTREWPAILSGEAGAYDFDLSPHAGLGLSSYGRSAEAGAMVRFGAFGRDRGGAARARLRRLGLTAVDGRDFGGRGRWYLFAAASGTAVGVNMVRDPFDGGWSAGGLSSDATARFVTNAQAGVAWRQGSAQASLGYVRRRVKIQAPHPELYPAGDNAVAFSFSIKPQP